MSNIAKFTAVRGNGLEFLAKYEGIGSSSYDFDAKDYISKH